MVRDEASLRLRGLAPLLALLLLLHLLLALQLLEKLFGCLGRLLALILLLIRGLRSLLLVLTVVLISGLLRRLRIVVVRLRGFRWRCRCTLDRGWHSGLEDSSGNSGTISRGCRRGFGATRFRRQSKALHGGWIGR